MATWKRCISFTLSLMMLLSIACVTVVSASPSEETILANQERANEAYNTMLEAFAQQSMGRSIVNGDDYTNAGMYPETYSGSFINDSGNLVVLLTDNDEQARQAILQAADEPNLLFQTAPYAYVDLLSSMEELRRCVSQKASSVLSDVTCAEINEQDNRVKIGIVDLTPAKIQQFQQEVFDDPWVIFENAEGPVVLDATVMAGGGVTIAGKRYSVGYPVKRGSQYGFLTSAHGTATVGQFVKYGDTSIGIVRARQFSGSVDASFVEITNSSWSASYMIQCTSNTLRKNYALPAQGTYIYKCGAATGKSYGKVSSNNFYSTTSGLTNLTLTTYLADEGDSGGIVYTTSNDICGIHHGRKPETNQGVFVKATAIRDGLGVSLY
ncbi:MAG: hypothetical protein ACOYJA_07330 [Christensenellales bacterium]|jgi:hypothetical protein